MLGMICLLATTLHAERAPRGPDDLMAEAELVVVGKIVEQKITSGGSKRGPGLGNYDWMIDLTLQVTKVEKGSLEGNSIVARGFIAKSRAGLVGYIGENGHHPLPGPGTMVRAHLLRRDRHWEILYPNGMTSPDGVEANLTETEAVRQLGDERFTFLLPIELWILFALIIGAGLLLRELVRWVSRKRS